MPWYWVSVRVVYISQILTISLAITIYQRLYFNIVCLTKSQFFLWLHSRPKMLEKSGASSERSSFGEFLSRRRILFSRSHFSHLSLSQEIFVTHRQSETQKLETLSVRPVSLPRPKGSFSSRTANRSLTRRPKGSPAMEFGPDRRPQLLHTATCETSGRADVQPKWTGR